MSELLDEALERASGGEGADAEAALASAVHAIGLQHGQESAAYAAALGDLATFCIATGEPRRALPLLRHAVAIRAPGRDAEQVRLTHAMNLGEVLRFAGELDEAEEVLRTSLREREAFYGDDHPGYGYGLEELAALLYARGQYEESLACVEGAIEIFWHASNARLTGAIATRAPIARCTGARAFDEEAYPVLSDEDFDRLVDDVLAHGQLDDPRVHLGVLSELRACVERRFGRDSDAAIRVARAIVDTARRANASITWGDAARWLAAAHDRRGERVAALRAALAAADADEAGGDREAARCAYLEAVARADVSGDPAIQSLTHRRYGLFLSRTALDPPGARAALGVALRHAESFPEGELGASELVARARAALGVALFHAGERDEAKPLLERGLETLDALDALDPDALLARCHLHAVRTTRAQDVGDMSCCHDLGIARSAAVRALVEREIGPGLIDDLRLPERDGDVDVTVKRPLQPLEAEHLQRALRHALAALRAKTA
jgi:tetratricopeptide (TPR) repeat protein